MTTSTEAEFLAYRDLCRQPWSDVATVLYGTGMRPGEAYKLRWEHVLLNGGGGMIQIADGKTKAARRFLPMLPEVYAVLKARHYSQSLPAEGWVFPAGSISGHQEENGAKIQHADALKKLSAASAVYEAWKNGNKGSWQDAVIAGTKLEADYVARHAEVLRQD